MVLGNRRDPTPVEPAILDGLGSLERLQKIWSYVRTTTATYAKDRTPQARTDLLGFLREFACDLAQHVEQILPRRDYRDLWQGPIGSGVNPVDQCVDPRSSAGLRPNTKFQLEVYDDQLPRLLQIADAVLARLAASQHAGPVPAPATPASTTPEQPGPVHRADEKLSDTKRSAIRKYGSVTIAFIEQACRDSGQGIGIEELAGKVGFVPTYLRDNVLTPLRQGQIIEYDEVTKKWVTNARKDALETGRGKKLCD